MYSYKSTVHFSQTWQIKWQLLSKCGPQIINISVTYHTYDLLRYKFLALFKH